MEKLPKMKNDLFYQIRHLKTFRKLSGNENGGIWCVRWLDGKNPEVYNDRNESIKFTVPDIHLAEYVASLHNSLNTFIKEVESKYD